MNQSITETQLQIVNYQACEIHGVAMNQQNNGIQLSIMNYQTYETH